MVEQQRIYFIAANFSAVESRREKAETGQPAAPRRERERAEGVRRQKNAPRSRSSRALLDRSSSILRVWSATACVCNSDCFWLYCHPHQ